jgi:two-component system chemotaxis sensor kinase CheA
LRFLPVFSEEFRDTMIAIQLRGVDLKRIPIRDKIRIYAKIIMPVAYGAADRAQKLSYAMELRAFRAMPERTSRITLKLPLTMAIIEALMVRAGSELFALPLFSISLIAEVEEDQVQTIQGRETISLQGRTIGLVRLNRLLNVADAGRRKKAYVVIVDCPGAQGREGSEIGFVVDALKEKQKIVVKSLDGELLGTSGISGVTILGDGQVALILDPAELAVMAGGSG